MKYRKTIKIAIITSLITAILTTIGSYFILNVQNRLVKANSSAQYRHELLKNFAENTAELELLREQAYWNKFFSVLKIKNKELLMESFPQNKYELLNQNNEYISNETEIRFRYQNVISKVNSLMLLIPSYYNSVDKEQLNSLSELMSAGFNFDIEYMESLYDNQSSIVNDGEELFDILNDSISAKYDHRFYNESLKIISLMGNEIR